MSATGPATAVARAPLHVLRVGARGAAPPDGVVERAWTGIDIVLPAASVENPVEACRRGLAQLDTTPLAWADVVVFSGWYATVPSCLVCDATSGDELALIEHARTTGHRWRRPYEGAVRTLLAEADRDPATWRTRGIVYEIDADPWAPDFLAAHPDLVPELDLVRHLLREADVVIAASQDAAQAARREGTDRGRLVVVAPGLDGEAARHAALTRAAQARDRSRFARRRSLRDEDARAAWQLRARQADGLPSWDPSAANDPLVTVAIAAVDEPAPTIARAIASALACEDVRIEVVVAGPAGSGAEVAAAEARDARVRWVAVERAVHSPTPATAGCAEASPVPRRLVERAGDPVAEGAAAMAAALAAASGAWLVTLDPAAVLVAGHPATLLGLAVEHGFDAVYGTLLLVRDGEPAGVLGAWPPARDTIAPDAALVSAALLAFRPDPDAPADGEAPLWNLWRRWIEAGARVANVEEPLALREALDADGAVA